LIFGAWPIIFHSSALCSIRRKVRKAQLAGADIYKSERLNMRFQFDGQNLGNVVDVINFGGLFSRNAIGSSRSVSL
jgi:hypothetical protein